MSAPDPRQGSYYVSCERDDGARVLVHGPYASHAAALDAVPDVRRRAERVDHRACWYAWGTARAEHDAGPGVLGGPGGESCSSDGDPD